MTRSDIENKREMYNILLRLVCCISIAKTPALKDQYKQVAQNNIG
jgi:hypothetical protein